MVWPHSEGRGGRRTAVTAVDHEARDHASLADPRVGELGKTLGEVEEEVARQLYSDLLLRLGRPRASASGTRRGGFFLQGFDATTHCSCVWMWRCGVIRADERASERERDWPAGDKNRTGRAEERSEDGRGRKDV
jgi:hypothetical protein